MNNKYLRRTYGVTTNIRPIVQLMTSGSCYVIDIYYRDIVKTNVSASTFAESNKCIFSDNSKQRLFHDVVYINGKYSSYGTIIDSLHNGANYDDFDIFTSNIAHRDYPGDNYYIVEKDGKIYFGSALKDEDACYNVRDITRLSGDENNGDSTTFKYIKSTEVFVLSNIKYKAASKWDDSIQTKDIISKVIDTSNNGNVIIRINIKSNNRILLSTKIFSTNTFIIDNLGFYSDNIIRLYSPFSPKFKAYQYTDDNGNKVLDIVYNNIRYYLFELIFNNPNINSFPKIEFLNEDYDSSNKTECSVINMFYENIPNASINNNSEVAVIDRDNQSISTVDISNIKSSFGLSRLYINSNIFRFNKPDTYSNFDGLFIGSTIGNIITFTVNMFNNNGNLYGGVYFLNYDKLEATKNVNCYYDDNYIYVVLDFVNNMSVTCYSSSQYSIIKKSDISTESLSKLDTIIDAKNIFGGSSNRPKTDLVYVGFQYFDTTLSKPIYWNGTKWVDSEGNDTDSTPVTSGTFANKPTGVDIGYAYFCTDKQTTEGTTNGIMIYYKGDSIWVDALGRVVS